MHIEVRSWLEPSEPPTYARSTPWDQLRMGHGHSVNPFRKFLLVSSCFIMFHHVSSCLIMSHHVSSCFIMFHHVSSCFIHSLGNSQVFGLAWWFSAHMASRASFDFQRTGPVGWPRPRFSTTRHHKTADPTFDGSETQFQPKIFPTKPMNW